MSLRAGLAAIIATALFGLLFYGRINRKRISPFVVTLVVWNGLLSFDYRFTKLLSGFLGYRWLYYDVDKGSGSEAFKYNVTHSGPLLALAFHW